MPDTAFVGTTIAIGIGLHWLLVPLAGATDFDERLLQPALQVLPIYLFMLVERAGGATRGAVRTYAMAIAAVAVVALVARVGIHMAGADFCRRICRALVPFDAIAAGLRDTGFKGKGTIVVRDVHLAGNLRVQFPGAGSWRSAIRRGYGPSLPAPPGSASPYGWGRQRPRCDRHLPCATAARTPGCAAARGRGVGADAGVADAQLPRLLPALRWPPG